MKNLKNNKGFSLVELIIVVAIMAILIGVLAPTYLKYVEKSRLSADNDTIDSIRKACETALADPDCAITGTFKVEIKDTGVTVTGDSNAETEIEKIVELDTAKIKSKAYKTNIKANKIPSVEATFDSNGEATVKVNNMVDGSKSGS